MGDGCVTELVERYRRNAEKCLEVAQSFNEPEAKRSLLAMANAWLMLAALRERSTETGRPGEPSRQVNEPHLPLDEPLKPPPADNPPAAKEPPPLRLKLAKPDDPLQC
jgi:hypothetical protein